MTSTTARARCLCGLFTTQVTGSFGDVRYCHCSQCRRKSGTAFTANARVRQAQWTLDGPREHISEYEHKAGLYNAFCGRCGSPLYARSDHDPDDIRVRLGGFAGPLDVKLPVMCGSRPGRIGTTSRILFLDSMSARVIADPKDWSGPSSTVVKMSLVLTAAVRSLVVKRAVSSSPARRPPSGSGRLRTG